jgi:type IV pilus assembly protein PilA
VAREDEGFTLLELMVVVLVIAILLATAIPTFLGARETANDRAAQSNLRNAHTNALVYYADTQTYTSNTASLEALDAALRYTNVLAEARDSIIYVETKTTLATLDTIYLGARSNTGSCFWMRTIGTQPEPRFAANDCLVRPDDGVFTDAW